MKKNTIIAESLINGLSIADKKSAMLNGDKIGGDNIEKWLAAVREAYQSFYRYDYDCRAVANGTKPTADNTVAMDSLQKLIDLIGEVNGHKLTRSPEMLSILMEHSMKNDKKLTGEADAVNTQLKNARKELREVKTGMSEEYINGIHARIATLEDQLSSLKKTTNSANKGKTRVSESTFRSNLETELALFITKQNAKTWEELEAEKEERRKARREATKAKKAAKKAAEAAVRKVGAEVTERAVQIAVERVESEATNA